ncbi:pseudouridine synthase [Rickettsiales endosymbiont of Trichoplax sp. H2]|uniref:pseudouridine synthase n=1 Tax=Rickettsiales endosymbiont of Trichoplax sp. H2 TaxID=2021221 RepID=UPI0012B23E01|nr:pseudouridine synthase [Rickettsiales endosymbiont of Trichoplax sp. H2]MSO14512.1 putative RNA pseudouridine synthase [Rickettsiales endosymbiont of Trichoplax sp. H2]
MSQIRITKALSHYGICSRRDAELLIAKNRVKVNNHVLDSPIYFVNDEDVIHVDDVIVSKPSKIRLWKYFKPKRVITSHKDNFGRTTLFEILPKNIGRVISVGRLDYNTEGLILLTNNGDLARKLELPATKLKRIYLCKAYGIMPKNMIQELLLGIKIDNIQYGPIFVEVYKKQNSNTWYRIKLYEGKNNEIRKVFAHFNLQVNRLIRTDYGNFSSKNMIAKSLIEIEYKEFAKLYKQETELQKN